MRNSPNDATLRRLLGSALILAVFASVGLYLWQPWDDGGAGQRPSPTGQPSVESPTATPTSGGLTGILATSDLSVGLNRVAFLALSPTALVDVPEVAVTSLYHPGDGSEPVLGEESTASFYLWPYGTRGNYVTQLNFDRPGEWELVVDVEGSDGSTGTARIPLTVRTASFTPAIGSLPPTDANKTVSDVASLDQITSWSTPDPDLYRATIPQAVNSGNPSMVVFASPALCTSPTCGPQVETVQEIKDLYQGRAGFIHVEVYDNPHEIQGDLSAARHSPLVEAWGLTGIEDYTNESWVFILDREGRVALKYQGFASAEELEQGLLQVL